MAAASPSPQSVDPFRVLTQARQGDPIETKEVPPYSPEWAKIAESVTYILLSLIGLVILLPFFLVFCTDIAGEKKAEEILDWAKTVLPPVVGFGGALVGYYFGTRGSQLNQSSDE